MLHQLAAQTQTSGNAINLLFPLLLVAAFFLLIVRPQRQRRRQLEQVRAALVPGAEVVTTAGLFGRVQAVDDEAVTLEVAPGVSLRFLRGAVGRVVTPAPFAPDPAPGERPAP